MRNFTKLLLLICFCVIGDLGIAQSFVSEQGGIIMVQKPDFSGKNEERGQYIGPHLLGDEVTRLMDQLEEKYVYYTYPSGAYSSKIRHVSKSNIYKAIKKFDKDLTKAVSQGATGSDEAQERLIRILNIGIKMINFDTTQAESDLKSLKKYKAIESYLLSLKFES